MSASNTVTSEQPDEKHGLGQASHAWGWYLLLGVYLGWVFLFSIIQPLTSCPDESAHVEYVKFLAEHRRLPVWQAIPVWSPDGGGEAGYESQHPPLYYALMAVVYTLAQPLAERWRWYVMRWVMASIGLAMFFICRRLFREFFHRSTLLPLFATATVLLMPLHLLYTCHVNPDALAMLWVTIALWLSIVGYERPGSVGRATGLGLVCGLGALTKLSAVPMLIIGILSQWPRTLPGQSDGRRTNATALAVVLGVFMLTCGWWYTRNFLLYGQVFVHTPGRFGSGLDNALTFGFGPLAWLTWRETYLSTWAQRGWFPAGLWSVVLYATVVAMTLLAGLGLSMARARPSTAVLKRGSTQFALNVSGLLVFLVFIGHQWAYWTVDLEFNAGGRYMLGSIAAIALLLVAGASYLGKRAGKVVLLGWVVALLVMNIVSAWHILAVLTPRHVSGWQLWHFPP